MSTLQIEGLWQFIQTMSLSKRNKQWLAKRLLESANEEASSKRKKSDTEYIMESQEMIDIIAEGDRQIESGDFTTTSVDALWN